MNRKLIDTAKRTMAAYPLYSQEEVEDKVVVMKLFDTFGEGVWYVVEYDPEDELIFCYVTGLVEDEWGYTSVRELAELTLRKTGTPFIEVDRHFTPTLFGQLKP